MRRSSKNLTRRYRARFCMAFTLVICLTVRAFPVQDIGGTLAFQGQDIIGGAAIIFKPPKRVRDLAGNTAAMLAAARRPSRSNRPAEVARNNNPTDKNRPAPQPQPTPTTTVATTTTAENRAEALKEQANTHYDRGDFLQAIAAYQDALKLDANDADVYNNLGASLYRAGRYQEASEAFQNAVRLTPNVPDALNNLGAVYYVLERYDRALDSFQKATAAKPDSADAHYNLGNAYYMSGRNREAATAYRKAIQLNPGYVEAKTNLGSLLISTDPRTAATELQESVKLRPN